MTSLPLNERALTVLGFIGLQPLPAYLHVRFFDREGPMLFNGYNQTMILTQISELIDNGYVETQHGDSEPDEAAYPAESVLCLTDEGQRVLTEWLTNPETIDFRAYDSDVLLRVVFAQNVDPHTALLIVERELKARRTQLETLRHEDARLSESVEWDDVSGERLVSSLTLFHQHRVTSVEHLITALQEMHSLLLAGTTR